MSEYKTVEQRASYGIGLQMGDQLSRGSFEGLDPHAVAAGLIDLLEGNEPKVAHADINTAFQEMQQRMQAAQQEQGKEAIEEGEKFLADNAKRDGVTVTESGLQYEIITEGSGDKPTAASTVSTHYHGTLINGEVFDSSVQRGQPAQFPVGGVIAGWTEALQLMPVGSKWRLFVPYNLAYGEQGAGGAIGPYTTLIFEVELLEIVS